MSEASIASFVQYHLSKAANVGSNTTTNNNNNDDTNNSNTNTNNTTNTIICLDT